MPDDAHLYAVAYRPIRRAETDQIDAWPVVLTVGSTLPVLPLALEALTPFRSTLMPPTRTPAGAADYEGLWRIAIMDRDRSCWTHWTWVTAFTIFWTIGTAADAGWKAGTVGSRSRPNSRCGWPAMPRERSRPKGRSTISGPRPWL